MKRDLHLVAQFCEQQNGLNPNVTFIVIGKLIVEKVDAAPGFSIRLLKLPSHPTPERDPGKGRNRTLRGKSDGPFKQGGVHNKIAQGAEHHGQPV